HYPHLLSGYNLLMNNQATIRTYIFLTYFGGLFIRRLKFLSARLIDHIFNWYFDEINKELLSSG
ncbi:hypothetical protein JW964_14635, partial [candidate division KSB1 bacterium]|nr:hypothetical protein [candidate division KSB1 bacterium]